VHLHWKLDRFIWIAEAVVVVAAAIVAVAGEEELAVAEMAVTEDPDHRDQEEVARWVPARALAIQGSGTMTLALTAQATDIAGQKIIVTVPDRPKTARVAMTLNHPTAVLAVMILSHRTAVLVVMIQNHRIVAQAKAVPHTQIVTGAKVLRLITASLGKHWQLASAPTLMAAAFPHGAARYYRLI
jgi:hypothetical protein